MSDETATPVTGTVDAPVSMDSIIADIAGGVEAPANDATAEAIADELVENAEKAGDADEAAEREESATEATDEADDAPKDEPETTDEAEPAYKVTVAGEEVDVPLSELLKGYSRERDYTAKTMALGEEKRALEAEKATAIPQIEAQYATELQRQVALFENADPILAEAQGATPEQIEAFKRDDPAGFVKWQDAVQQRVAMINDAKQQIGTLQQRAQQAQQEEIQAAHVKAASVLADLRPELADPEVLSAFATKNFDYLRTEGEFDDSDLRLLATYPKAMIIADKARKYDEQEAAKATLPAKKVVPKPVVRNLTTDASDSSRAPTARFPRSSSVVDKADWVARQIMSQGT